MDETLSTLAYADRAKSIIVRAHKNEQISEVRCPTVLNSERCPHTLVAGRACFCRACTCRAELTRPARPFSLLPRGSCSLHCVSPMPLARTRIRWASFVSELGFSPCFSPFGYPMPSPPLQVGKLKSEVDLLRRKLADAAGTASSEEERAQLQIYRSQARPPAPSRPAACGGHVAAELRGRGGGSHGLHTRPPTLTRRTRFRRPTQTCPQPFSPARLTPGCSTRRPSIPHSHPPSFSRQVEAYEARLAVSFEQTAAVAAQLAAATEAARLDVSEYHASRRAALRSLFGPWLPLLWADNRAWAEGFLPKMAAVQVRECTSAIIPKSEDTLKWSTGWSRVGRPASR